MPRRPSIPQVLAIILVLTYPVLSLAQQADYLPETVEDALHQMSDSAGVIFTGEVVNIRIPSPDRTSGLVEIDFLVDQAIRGCADGSIYTLREWQGLWPPGEQRYRTGQRLLMLLHAPSIYGTSSPVGGMTGAIPILPSTTAPEVASSATVSTPLIVDLRWVGTRLVRSSSYASPVLISAFSAPPVSQPSSIAAQQAPVSIILDMLRSWQQPNQP